MSYTLRVTLGLCVSRYICTTTASTSATSCYATFNCITIATAHLIFFFWGGGGGGGVYPKGVIFSATLSAIRGE